MKIAKQNAKTIVNNKYSKAVDMIRKTIDELGVIANSDSNDDLVRDAIANLSVVLFDLQSAE